jgi:hypothetical protein
LQSCAKDAFASSQLSNLIFCFIRGNNMSQGFSDSPAVAQWRELVQDATQRCDSQLNDELESYLVFMLMRHMSASELASTIVALDYLRSSTGSGRVQTEQLSKIGDNCLLLSGLFPGRAERRRVRISYYVNLGISAYARLGDLLKDAQATLYKELSKQFVCLMDILHAARELDGQEPTLQPLQAIEVWNDTRSRHAHTTLQHYSQGFPIFQEVPQDRRLYN